MSFNTNLDPKITADAARKASPGTPEPTRLEAGDKGIPGAPVALTKSREEQENHLQVSRSLHEDLRHLRSRGGDDNVPFHPTRNGNGDDNHDGVNVGDG